MIDELQTWTLKTFKMLYNIYYIIYFYVESDWVYPIYQDRNVPFDVARSLGTILKISLSLVGFVCSHS